MDAQTRPDGQPAGQAGDLAAAKQAYARGQYRRAAVLLLPLARQGDADAQYALGYLYYYGLGVPRDAQRAVHWIGQAASRGHEKAQRALLRVSGGPPEQPPPGPGQRPGAGEAPEPPQESPGESPPSAPPSKPLLGPPDEMMEAPDDPVEDSSANPAEEGAPAPASGHETVDPTAGPALTAAQPDEAVRTREQEEQSASEAENPAHDNATTPGIRDTAWVVAQSANHFTIQLVATSSARRAQEFMKRHDLMENGAYFQSARRGQPWFSVLYGSYPEFEKARHALAGLEPDLREASPWIRDFGSVQREIAGQ